MYVLQYDVAREGQDAKNVPSCCRLVFKRDIEFTAVIKIYCIEKKKKKKRF